MIEVCGYNLLKAEGRCCEAYCPKDLFSWVGFCNRDHDTDAAWFAAFRYGHAAESFPALEGESYTLKLRKIGTRLMFRIGGVHKGTRRRK